MFFNEEEMLVAEDLAWKMLDWLNHANGYYDISEFAYFYFRDRKIFDPWMNEKSQELPWPDHESKKSAVDPIEYYGVKTIENYLVRLFMLRPEWNPLITEKIKKNLSDEGKLRSSTTIMPIETFIAMPEAQAREEGGYSAIEDELPDSRRIYFEMTKLPKDLICVNNDGWEKEIEFHKKDAKKVMKLLYPNGVEFDYQKLIDRVMGNRVLIIGFGD